VPVQINIADTIYDRPEEDLNLSRHSLTIECADSSYRGKPKTCPCGLSGVITRNKTNGYTAYERYCKTCRTNWRSHGLRPSDVLTMLVKQGFRCLAPSCAADVGFSSCVDHRHGCGLPHRPGRVSCAGCQRGILCKSCNTFEGQVKKFFRMSEESQEWWKSYAL
jgi:Recombination endonuclease VII